MQSTKKKKKKFYFIHSGYRCGSTFFFSAFKNSKNIIKYYEIYNSLLSSLNFQKINNIGSKSWESKHPYIKSYFSSYRSFFKNKKNSKIINLIEKFKNTKEITINEQNYLNALNEKKKIIFFFNTGYLNKVKGLINTFGGFHLLLIRNPFSQFSSILYLYKRKNSFFYNFYLKKKLIKKKNFYEINSIQSAFLDFYEEMIRQYINIIDFCDKIIFFDNFQNSNYKKKIIRDLNSIDPSIKINLDNFNQSFSFVSELWVNYTLIKKIKKKSKIINSNLTCAFHKNFEKKILKLTLDNIKKYLSSIKYCYYEINSLERNSLEKENLKKRIKFINDKYEKLSLLYKNQNNNLSIKNYIKKIFEKLI